MEYADVRDTTTNVGIRVVSSSAYNGSFIYIRPQNASESTLDGFKSWLAENTLQVVYPLANPQTIQLSAQEIKLLLGDNNVWSDGNVTLVYNADIQKWVEKKLGTSTTLTMSRPMTEETETTETEETETAETE